MSAPAEHVEFESIPTSLGVLATIAAAVVTTIASGVTLTVLPFGLVGLVVTTLGVRRGSRRVHTVGSAFLFGAVLLAGVVGAPAGRLLIATAGAIVAWDAGDHAIGLARQVGRGSSRRAILVHVAITAAVTTCVGVVCFIIYRFADTVSSTAAIASLLVAAVLFVWLLDR